MGRIRRKQTTNQPRAISIARPVAQQAMPLDDGTVTTPVTLAMIQLRIPELRPVRSSRAPMVADLQGSRSPTCQRRGMVGIVCRVS